MKKDIREDDGYESTAELKLNREYRKGRRKVGNSRAPRNATEGIGKFPPPLKKIKKVLDKH
jgi:hypothetical protein